MDADTADILLIRCSLFYAAYPGEGPDIGRRARSRNPDIAYFHFAVGLTHDPTEGLRACKAGLACTNTTPYVRASLLRKAVEHAGFASIRSLHGAAPGSSKYQAALAMLKSALDDVKTFITEIPPDNKYMARML